MATPLRKSAEEYLETILILTKAKTVVHSVDIAIYMNYSKPSVSRAVGNLRKAGYVNMAQNGELTLTPTGLQKAKNILERHQVLTKMFTMLGVPKDIAAQDACEVEHVISDDSFSCIKEYVQANGTSNEKREDKKKKGKKDKK